MTIKTFITMLMLQCACFAAEPSSALLSALPRAPVELELRWKALRELAQRPTAQLPSDPAAIQDALQLSAESGAMLSEEQPLYQSYWGVIDRMLRGVKPADLLPLRELQENKTRALAGEIRRAGDLGEAVRMFRRYPWAHSVQGLMLDLAEDALHDGRANWAVPAFQDVLTHADDPVLLAQARVGRWLALAACPEWRGDLERSMSMSQDDEILPWRGGSMKASLIKEAIRSPAQAQGGPSAPLLSGVKLAKIRLPAAFAAMEPLASSQQLTSSGLGAWAIRRFESANDLFVVIGSRHVACYDAATMKLRRLCGTHMVADPSWVEPPSRPAILGQEWNSAIGASRAEDPSVYSLVMNIRTDTPEYDIAAWDTGSGRMLWTTAGQDQWKELVPQSEPIAGDGCLYVLAIGRKATKTLPLYLVCLDSNSGAISWQRLLGGLPADTRLSELILPSGTITLHQGSLYISTDLGLTARCSARDGAMDWVRTYPGRLITEQAAISRSREGTAPLVADDKVFIAPLDHSGVMALDKATGKLLWERTPVGSDRMVGANGKVLVTQSASGLAGLDAASGADVWTRPLDETVAPRALLLGEHVLVTAGNHVFRFLASSGASVDELRLDGEAGSVFAMLADGSLVEFVEERMPDPIEQPGTVAGPIRLPLSEQWMLPCERPLLVAGSSGSGGTNMFAVLSVRLLLCMEAEPRGRIVWQSRLSGRPDSVGFHGKLLVAARDRTLMALNASTGATEWGLRLPFRADIVGGDERMLFAGELTRSGAVAAIEPDSGKVLWRKSFGEDARLSGGQLEWISLQTEAAGAKLLHLYWSSAALGSEGNRPAEVVVDAASGAVRDVRRFLPGEPQWPRQIAFSDERSYAHLTHRPPWPSRGPFPSDAMAYVGDGATAHFSLLANGKDLHPGRNLVMDIKPEAQYWSSAGLNATSDGLYVRRLGQLTSFESNSTTCTSYELPRNVPTRTAFNILDFSTDTGTLMVVSGSASGLPDSTGGRPTPYRWDRLQDCTGKGMVSLQCFKGIVQIGHSTLQLPEAGSNPTATLLNGQVDQRYQDTRIRLGNLSSLGWSKYDVYLYGFGGTADIDGVVTQQCGSADYTQIANRTAFVAGVNYVKFAGLSRDEFTLNLTKAPFSAIQIVNASPGASREKPEGLGINWTGGGPALKSTDTVGAEVACGNWYNINEYDLITGGLTNAALVRAFMSVDVFDRATGRLTGTQELPGGRARAHSSGYLDQARLFNGGLLTTDAMGVYFLRSSSTNTSQ